MSKKNHYENEGGKLKGYFQIESSGAKDMVGMFKMLRKFAVFF
jgi:hypothetical protein